MCEEKPLGRIEVGTREALAARNAGNKVQGGRAQTHHAAGSLLITVVADHGLSFYHRFGVVGAQTSYLPR
jgi:hypothetical protein